MVTALTRLGWIRKGSAWSFAQGSAKYPTAVMQMCRKTAKQASSFSLYCRDAEKQSDKAQVQRAACYSEFGPGRPKL